MQAIQVKYLSATNNRGTRLKATAAAGSITKALYSLDANRAEDQAHEVAQALVEKLGWTDPAYGRLIGGQLKDGSYVFVFAPGGGAYTADAMDRHDRVRGNNPRRVRRVVRR